MIIVIKVKKYTHFLNSLINVNKTFKIFILMKKLNELKIFLKKFQI